MATMLMPPSSPAASERVLRIPLIAANLLPVEIVERRRGRRIRRLVIVALILVIVLLGAWFAGSSYQTREARSDLARAEADAAAMQQQQGAFGELLDTQVQSAKVKTQLSTLMADDLSWTKLVSGLRTAAPSTVRLTAVIGGLPQDVTGPDTGKSVSGLPNAADAMLIGSLSVSGVGKDKTAVSAYFNAVAKLPGVANALLRSAAQPKQRAGVAFSIDLDITSAALGGRYTTQAAGTGGR